jgi:pyruvate-formate lyase-activating enzyme
MKAVTSTLNINTSELYRMPWTMSDNGFTWLEPTRKCNMACEYCYQRNDPKSQKSLAQIDIELRALFRLRKCDTLLIAGGEPLTHPQIIEITKMVKGFRVKPVILTNGQALTQTLVRELKKAGAYGFVFHIDSHQFRPGWKSKSEKELNDLRQEFADMLYEEGGLVCAYNTTILPETLHEVADIVDWTTRNIHKVAANVLIPVRAAHPNDPWDYYAGVQKIAIEKSPYVSKKPYKHLTALDICQQIWMVHPHYRFHSYLGGTVLADSPKWLFGTHIGSSKRLYGNLGPKATEILQNSYHLFTGKYLSFTSSKINRKAKLIFPFALVDKGIRELLKKRFRTLLKNPLALFEKLSVQNIIVMQPHDFLPNGEQDECDGCPNKTYWNGRLVSECRKEDYLTHGRPIIAARAKTAAADEKQTVSSISL